MSEGLFAATDMAAPGRVGFRLHRAEVLNWGTFDGQVHRLLLGGETALVTGDIGSGKSTLVDAITTLLLPAGRITYNKAAGAGARERTLRSYVEGYYKSERTETTGRSRSIGLRSGGGSFSVILGVFRNEGYDETATLAQVFQQRETAGQPYRFFVTAPREMTIAADFAGFGSSLTDLRKRLRGAGASVFDEFPAYGTSLRRLLGVRSEQALELFGQTVSMKSVGNLDDFVRQHMLEPADADEQIRGIVAHFEDLTHAYDAVRRAREQLDMLTPITVAAARFDTVTAEREALEAERTAIGPFVAGLTAGLLRTEIAELEGTRASLESEHARLAAEAARLGARRVALIEERVGAGGSRISELERAAAEARAQADTRRTARTAFDAAAAEAELDVAPASVVDEATFARLGAAADLARPAVAARTRTLGTDLAEAIGAERQAAGRVEALSEEITSLTGRESNIPLGQIALRAELCATLSLDPADLPFAGELIDVADGYDDWRGAAERVLRGFALSLLVPQRHYAAVGDWVNSRRLTVTGPDGRTSGARLVYLRLPERRIPVAPQEHHGLLLVDCLDVRPGPFAAFVQGELASRADHRCAATMMEFRASRRAVTAAGQVRSGDRHEKDDRYRVDDPRHWVLGWVNERKIAALAAERDAAAAERDADAARAADFEAERDALQRRNNALVRLDAFRSWIDLDSGEALARADACDGERARLAAGSARLAEITGALEAVEADAARVGGESEAVAGRLATNRRDGADRAASLAEAEGVLRAAEEAGRAAAAASYPAIRERLAGRMPDRSDRCASVERALLADVHAEIETRGGELAKVSTALTRQMSAFLARWPELRADMDDAVEARTDFVALATRVGTDDLPRFEATFREQLRTKAIQELAAFNNWLGRQADAIDERVGRINEALSAVPYNPGRYIRLEKQSTTSQDVAEFRRELRDLTDDSLNVDGETYSEERFVDVKRIIERFQGREGHAEVDRAWTRRVTDVRGWFVFSASERDRATDVEWEHYSDSDGKSGGQKEKLAYTILAASLAYQFGLTWGAPVARDFRFAVIDEAFGRGSDASTRYALELFARLGLQLLVVTPLQKVHVIEPFVRAIGFVDNPTGTASRVHTMTIEQYRDGRSAR